MFFSRNQVVYSILKIVAYIIFKFYFRLEVYGRKNIVFLKGPFMLASNHQSYLDPPVLGAASPRPLRFIARENLFRNFIFGDLISVLGAIPVNSKQVDIDFIKRVCNLLKKGENLAIFPEGTRSPEGLIQKGRPGVGYLVDKTKAPVIPAYISGSGKALPLHSWWIKFCKIKVFFGEPLILDSLFNINEYKRFSTKEKYRKITDAVMEKIRELARRAKSREYGSYFI